MRKLGRDFSNQRYSPRRIGKPLASIDTTFDYDFDRLRAATSRLRGVDRAHVLRAIFARVTAGATTPTERHLRVARFVQETSFHSEWLQPMYRDRSAVFDPLVLLELNEMRCGQASRVGADLFLAAGYRARIAQVGAHVLAEFWYEGDWHYFDADIFDAGAVARDRDGSIPSLSELSRRSELLDRLSAYVGFNPQTETWMGPKGRRMSYGFPHPASYYFSRKGYGMTKPLYYVKTATTRQAQASRFFGWNFWKTLPNTSLRITNEPIRYAPGAPLWRSVTVDRRKPGIVTLALSWDRPVDRDGDLAGYRVTVGTRSRGWQLDKRVSSAAVAPFVKDIGWRPADYDALGHPYPEQAGSFRTRARTLRIPLRTRRTYFVSVTGLDRYGLRIGKRTYFAAEELTIRT